MVDFIDAVEIDIIGFGVDVLTREFFDATLVVCAKAGRILNSTRSSLNIVGRVTQMFEVVQCP